MKQVAYGLFETPLGWCGIAWSESGKSRISPAVCRLQLPEATAKLTESRIARDTGACKSNTFPPHIAAVIEKVRKHLQGVVQNFHDIAIDLDEVSAFERQVYQAARAIPAGQTGTYGEIAKAIRRSTAARAVGQALGKNPIGLIIPCHRVLAAGGKPGGFSAHGGRATKTRMLAIEGTTFGPPPTIKSLRDLQRTAALLKAKDTRLARCLAKPIEFRLKPAQSPYVTLVEAVIHQQLSSKAASTILARVKALYPGVTMPTPRNLLNTPDQLLRNAGLSRAKTASLKDLATKTLDGTVPSLKQIVTLGDQEIVQRLTSIYGVGRWTVEMLLIFNLGRRDIFPIDDYALRKCIAEVYGMPQAPTPKQLNALGESWRPYRTVASLYLWNFINPKET
ncbi:MAG: methylated-DNA--[protein]-cysteine S-methyltransferase [Gammaproteobacteria bacterium]|nr:methylated-DNA--[protein]-cysteine S-methyltransferase [Gammaproteobacteria bacterium]